MPGGSQPSRSIDLQIHRADSEQLEAVVLSRELGLRQPAATGARVFVPFRFDPAWDGSSWELLVMSSDFGVKVLHGHPSEAQARELALAIARALGAELRETEVRR